MPKTKTRDKAPEKAPPPPTIVQKQAETPEKQGGPLPATRAADLITAPEQSAGAAGRARVMTDMQLVPTHNHAFDKVSPFDILLCSPSGTSGKQIPRIT